MHVFTDGLLLQLSLDWRRSRLDLLLLSMVQSCAQLCTCTFVCVHKRIHGYITCEYMAVCGSSAQACAFFLVL